MSGIPLATLLPELGNASRNAVEYWVTAALANASALRQHDASLFSRDPARQAAADHLHETWRAWVEDANTVLNQAETVTTGDSEIAGLADLRMEIGFAKCMLKMTPALIAQRRAQVERGEVYSAEEVRRALRTSRLG